MGWIFLWPQRRQRRVLHDDFEYYNPAKIVFGEHSEQKLKSLLVAYGVKSLQLVYSGDFIKTLGIYDVIKDAAAIKEILKIAL